MDEKARMVVLTAASAVAVMTAIVTVAVDWGSSNQRLVALEKRIDWLEERHKALAFEYLSHIQKKDWHP